MYWYALPETDAITLKFTFTWSYWNIIGESFVKISLISNFNSWAFLKTGYFKFGKLSSKQIWSDAWSPWPTRRLLSLVWAFFEQMWRRQMLIYIHQQTFFNLFVNAWCARQSGSAQIAVRIKRAKKRSEISFGMSLHCPRSVIDFYCSGGHFYNWILNNSTF